MQSGPRARHDGTAQRDDALEAEERDDRIGRPRTIIGRIEVRVGGRDSDPCASGTQRDGTRGRRRCEGPERTEEQRVVGEEGEDAVVRCGPTGRRRRAVLGGCA